MEFEHQMSTPTLQSKANLTSYAIIILQLACLLYLGNRFALEPSLQLTMLYALSLAGFLVQVALPVHWRKAFFLILGIAATGLFAGWLEALFIFSLGTTLTACAVYIRPKWLMISTIMFIAAILIGLLAYHGAWIEEHLVIFSTIGTMFMFRMMLFMYDRPHLKEKPRFWEDLNYFFMLPNMAIYLFPVVDYKTFVTRYLDEPGIQIYKKGVRWMVLGMFHLILYRVVYSQWLLPVAEVTDLLSLSQYTITNYLLIIRLSGIFHTAAGILCLFGYNLPATFNNYFLASGFSDLWRRINIYFRDYLLKVFYYPIFFKLRKKGHVMAVTVTILILFTLTWLLHSWQWFWIKGIFPIRWLDIIFWGVFGLMVAGNALYDMKKHTRQRMTSSWGRATIRALKVTGMLIFMSILWALWSANSLPDWISTISKATKGGDTQILLLLLLLVITFSLGTIAAWVNDRFNIPSWLNPEPNSYRSTMLSVTTILALMALQMPQIPHWIEKQTSVDLTPIVTGQLNQSDQVLMIEGYYGEILVGNELTSPISQLGRPKIEKLKDTGGKMLTNDFRHIAIQPNSQLLFKGKAFSTNRWGMRDKDYNRVPDPNAIRTLVMGGSIVLGSGISDEEVFDNHLEDDLNKQASDIKYEFLNLSCSSYDLIDCNIQFEVDSLHLFQPDYLIFFSHGIDLEKSIQDIARNYKSGTPMPYPYLISLLDRHQISQDMTMDQIVEAIKPDGLGILEDSYKYLYQLCQRNHIEPIWILWPPLSGSGRQQNKDQAAQVRKMVMEIGFTAIDLSNAYDDYDQVELQVGLFDMHPNALGHRIIAEKLVDVFTSEYPLKNRR